MERPVRKTTGLGLFLAACVALAAACASQGEGERCNSDEDCGLDSAGNQLACTTSTALAGGSARVCCPVGNASSSAEFCSGASSDLVNPDASGVSTGDDDASAETDAGDDAGGSSSGGSSSSSSSGGSSSSSSSSSSGGGEDAGDGGDGDAGS